MDPRRGYELHTLFLGRRIRPFHLAVTIATAVVAWTLLDTPNLPLFDHSVTRIIGLAAATAALLLTYGWWFRSDRAASGGLLLATGVWASRAAYAAIAGEGILIVNQWPSFFLSLAWTIGAGGAYQMERADIRAADGNV